MLAWQAWAADNFVFSAVCSSGQTLYYSITSSTEPYTAQVVFPRYSNDNNYYNYTRPTGDLVIPEKVTNYGIEYSVTSIGESAFSGCSGLTSVTIPNSVTSIGSDAFRVCSGLASVTIPNTVTSIGKYAFAGCSGLTSVAIPENVWDIGEYAFDWCTNLTTVNFNATNCQWAWNPFSSSLTTLNIGDNVQTVPARAFKYCRDLRTLIIPNSVTSIGVDAFYKCENLNKLNIPNSIVSIGFDCFPKLSELKNLQFNEYGNACYIGNEENPYLCLVKAKSTEITSCTINAKCKAIYDGAFKGCEELTSIAIPNTVTFIGRNAFEDCINLTIYCQAKVKHSKWHSDWNPNWCDVVWGATYKFK